jgi:hypothetical protein
VALTDTIIARLYPHIKEAGISRHELVSTAAQTLERFDKAAATYYTSYHPKSR